MQKSAKAFDLKMDCHVFVTDETVSVRSEGSDSTHRFHLLLIIANNFDGTCNIFVNAYEQENITANTANAVKGLWEVVSHLGLRSDISDVVKAKLNSLENVLV